MNKLELPEIEFKQLYTSYLLMKELLITDITLFIFSLSFLYKKQQAFNNEIDFSYLKCLEDRFINGIVLYHLASGTYNDDYYRKALILLKKGRSAIELLYVGHIYKYGRGVVKCNNDKVIKYYKMAADLGNVEAMSNLGCNYYFGDRVNKDINIAILYFEKAILLNHTLSKMNLAYILRDSDTVRSNNLYISAAKDGNEDAIMKCNLYQLKID